MAAIQKNGYKADQEGLSAFNLQFMQSAAVDPSLQELNRQKWLYLFETAFGIREYREISLETARRLIAGIADEMTQEPFLLQVDEAMETIGPDASFVEKRKALLRVIFPLHRRWMERVGFEGRRGMSRRSALSWIITLIRRSCREPLKRKPLFFSGLFNRKGLANSIRTSRPSVEST